MKNVTNTENNPRVEWLMGGNPNAIENQEAEGQQELVNSAQLPTNSNTRGIDAKEQYEKMGIKVLGVTEGDEIFFDVEMPKGWKKEATDHAMWNKLIDDQGRERAMFFYKAAFYDRSSHIDFNRRFNVVGNYIGQTGMSYQVKDNKDDVIVYETEVVTKGEDTREYYRKTDALRLEAEKFLRTRNPDFEDVNAYWD